MAYIFQAVAYVRVASAENAAAHLAEQEQRIRVWAAQHHFEIVRVYADIGSGNHAYRPALQQLVKDADPGAVGTVIVTDYSRLFRRLDLLVRYLTRLRDDYGVTVLVVDREGVP